MYWATDPLFGNLFIPRVMKRDRFDKICQYLHVNDTSSNPRKGQPGHDKLAHVRPLVDHINQKCSELWNTGSNVSIDEAMIAFRGRLGWRQYIPSKPTKYGIKVWMKSDPGNGFCSSFQIYTGRTTKQPELGLGGRVVSDLVDDLSGTYTTVNCDNFFSSPALFLSLLEKKICARGTVRADRKGMPPAALFNKKMKIQGESCHLSEWSPGCLQVA